MSEQNNSQEDSERNPYTKPGFLISAFVVVVILVVAAVVIVMNLQRGSTAPSSPSTSPSTVPATPSAEHGASVCGLKGEVTENATLSRSPQVSWKVQGLLSYPQSEKYGPGATSEDGYRYCFQHSPEGAVVAAANALVQGANATAIRPWLTYFLAESPYRAQIISSSAEMTSDDGMRAEIIGFQLMSYDGKTAQVDIALRGSAQGQEITLSSIYKLKWENGDWKLVTDSADELLNVAAITNTDSYLVWKE